jgi:hypothetical protein
VSYQLAGGFILRSCLPLSFLLLPFAFLPLSLYHRGYAESHHGSRDA